MSVANPVTTSDSGNTWLEGLLWGDQWSSGSTPTYMEVYIAGVAGLETVDFAGSPVTATVPYSEELIATVQAMQLVENVCNVDFLMGSSTATADLVWASVNDADASGALGIALPPGYYFNPANGDWQSVVITNYEAYAPGLNGLEQGGFDFVTFIHELGHALGLAHPHDTGGTSTVFPGVGSPFGDYGDFDMNQGVYTTMSYNDGWQVAPHGLSPSTDFGYQGTFMALDIAALQFMYGANMSYRTGNDVYSLPQNNQIGTFYSCIWDAGGVDAISNIGSSLNSRIDLREATLQYGPGGGGYISYATGIHGGFTIANGAVIENAFGGDGNDTIYGNAIGNRIEAQAGKDGVYAGDGNDFVYGNAGEDRLAGEAGNDYLYGNDDDDRLLGDAGIDRLFSGAGRDALWGGTERDYFIYQTLADSPDAGDRIYDFQLALDDIHLTGIDANETLAGNQNFSFIGAAAFGVNATGQLRYFFSGADTVIQLSTDADAAAEMTVRLTGNHVLTATDFFL